MAKLGSKTSRFFMVSESRVHVAAGRILRFRDHDQAHCQVRPCVAQLLGSHCLLQQLRCQICVGLRETSTYRVVFVADGGLRLLGLQCAQSGLQLRDDAATNYQMVQTSISQGVLVSLSEYNWVRDTLQPMCVIHLRETFRKSRIPRSVVDGDSLMGESFNA